MKTLITGLFLFAALNVFAQNRPAFTLQDNRSGEVFNCGIGGANPQPPTNQNCVRDTATYCNNNTSFSSNDCFAKASKACKGAGANFASCVAASSNYCNNNTSLSSNLCFENALESCSGQFSAQQVLIEATLLQQMLKNDSRK